MPSRHLDRRYNSPSFWTELCETAHCLFWAILATAVIVIGSAVILVTSIAVSWRIWTWIV